MAQGTLSIDDDESRVDGTLIIKKGAVDPPAAATTELQAKGFEDGDPIIVEGPSTMFKGEVAIAMTGAKRPSEEAVEEEVALTAASGAAIVRAVPKKPARKKKPRAKRR